MATLNKFEIFILSLAVFLVLAGIWGVNYQGFIELDTAEPAEKIGEVTAIRKGSEVKRRPTQSFHWASLDRSNEVYEKDTVYVGPGSNLRVTLIDNSEITIGEDSLVIFEKSKLLNTSDGDAGIVLVKGELSVQGNPDADGDSKLDIALENEKSVSISRQTQLTISKRNKMASIILNKPMGGDIVFKEAGREVKKVTTKKDSKSVILQGVSLASQKPIQVPELQTFDIAPIPSEKGRNPAKTSDEGILPLIKALRKETETAANKSDDSTEILFKPANVSDDLISLKTAALDTYDPAVDIIPSSEILKPKETVAEELSSHEEVGKDISSLDAEEESKAEATEPVALIFPKDQVNYDFRSRISALDLRFRVKEQKGKNFVLQFSNEPMFRTVLLRTLVEKNDLISEETDTKGAKYATSLSGLYLALSEGFMRQIYDKKKIYWRVVTIDEKTGAKQASKPRSMTFQVRDTIKIQTQVERVKDKRKPANVMVSQLAWQIVGQIPSQYKVTFSKDGYFRDTICSENVPSSLIYFKKDERVSNLNLWAEEKYQLDPATVCKQASAPVKGLKHVYYKIEALDYDGKAIRYEHPNLARGVISLN